MAARRNSRLIFRLLALALGWTALAACQPADPDTPFAIYLHLLETALLDTDLPGTTSLISIRNFPPFPYASNLQLGSDTPAIAEIEKIDILELSGCTLQLHLVRRTSTLGRHAKPSQRLFLELDYLRQSPACADTLRQGGNNLLAETLERGWRARQQQLAALVFNATLGSHEYRAFWRAKPGLRSYPSVDHRVTVRALEGIDTYARHWLRGEHSTDDREPEILLGDIAGGGGGSLLESLTRYGDWLKTADQSVAAQLERYPNCLNEEGVNTRLLAQAQRYFITELEPRITDTQRRATELLSPVAALEEQLQSVLPHHYLNWRKARDQYLKELGLAPARHLALLSHLRQTCASI